MRNRTGQDQVLDLARRHGVLRIRDVRARGLHPEHVRRLHAKGLLLKVGRGLYTPADAEVSPHFGLALACKAVPHGVGCLLTALRFHGIGTQAPAEVWLALDRRAARPRVEYPPLRVVRFSGQALTDGVEHPRVNGVRVRVYTPAKTVADCFKYRNKIGLDVALEALRECLGERRTTIDELWRYAGICRVTTAIRPYLEALA